MSPEELLDQGRPADALVALEQVVRAEPAKARHRLFLFQLLSVMGQWERALLQLNVAAELGPELGLTAKMYGPVLHCEAFRAKVFAGEYEPLVFGPPEPWIARLVQANHLLVEGSGEAAAELRRAALREAAPRPGTLNGKPFRFLVDADSRLGPVLEVILEGKYFWVPMTRIRRIEVLPPKDLHDLVWSAAVFTWSNGGQAGGFVPVRYPGAGGESDAAVLLARKTEWTPGVGDTFTGHGQRLLATDAEAVGLLDLRLMTCQTEDAGAADPEPGAGATGAAPPAGSLAGAS